MKQILSFLLVLLSFWLGSAQVTVNNITPLQAANALTNGNSGIQIISATTNSIDQIPANLGSFTGANSIIGFDSGIILATGDIMVAECINQPNQAAPCGPQYWNVEAPHVTGAVDADLAIASPGGQNSAFVLEIDFIAYSTSVEFEFVFASEEYHEYVGTQYNDAFGFFLSGGPITGPYSGGGVNLALVPGTALPINIQNINRNQNAAFFRDNNCRAFPNDPAPCPFPNFSYDGYTVPITADYRGLECGEQYKLKLVISNIADFRVGSAVFIKSNSLQGGLDAGPATASPNPVCAGQPLTLSCAGDPANTYVWHSSTGAILGTGQTITVTANPAQAPYSVAVSNPLICSEPMPLTVDVNIHVAQNIAPYTQGIDNTGEHEYYVYSGEPFDFDIFSYDADNENVSASLAWTGAPPPNTSYTFHPSYTPLNKDHKSVHLSGAIGPPGEYPFVLTLTDDNVCGPKITQETFTIIVMCGDCAMDVLYEKRGAGNPVLPTLTEAAYKIRAGNSVDPAQTDGPVIVNSGQNVVFKAGEFVLLEPGFSVTPGGIFLAQIAPSNCEGSCGPENCCQGPFEGFRYDPIPNIITPNGDNDNDLWFVSDSQFPYCAYNAKGFDLVIYGRYGTVVHSLSSSANYCCAFQSIISNSEHPDIYWDGISQQTNNLASTGVYDYVLKFFGCDGAETEISGIITVSY